MHNDRMQLVIPFSAIETLRSEGPAQLDKLKKYYNAHNNPGAANDMATTRINLQELKL